MHEPTGPLLRRVKDLVEGGDEAPHVTEEEQPHDAQSDAGQPVLAPTEQRLGFCVLARKRTLARSLLPGTQAAEEEAEIAIGLGPLLLTGRDASLLAQLTPMNGDLGKSVGVVRIVRCSSCCGYRGRGGNEKSLGFLLIDPTFVEPWRCMGRVFVGGATAAADAAGSHDDVSSIDDGSLRIVQAKRENKNMNCLTFFEHKS